MNNNPRQIGEYITATDPNRGAMAKSYSVVPGGPQNNNPGNALSFNGAPNTYPSAYGDMVFNGAPQLQTVMPMPVSQMPQQVVVGRGYNRQAAMTPQPDPRAGDQMNGMYQGNDAARRGLQASMMGPVGTAVDMRQPLPGGSLPTPQQAPNTMPLTTVPPEMAAQQNAMSRMGKGSRGPGGMRT